MGSVFMKGVIIFMIIESGPVLTSNDIMKNTPTLTKEFQKNIGEATLNISKYWYDVGKREKAMELDLATKAYLNGYRIGFKNGKFSGGLMAFGVGILTAFIISKIKNYNKKESAINE